MFCYPFFFLSFKQMSVAADDVLTVSEISLPIIMEKKVVLYDSNKRIFYLNWDEIKNWNEIKNMNYGPWNEYSSHRRVPGYFWEHGSFCEIRRSYELIRPPPGFPKLFFTNKLISTGDPTRMETYYDELLSLIPTNDEQWKKGSIIERGRLQRARVACESKYPTDCDKLELIKAAYDVYKTALMCEKLNQDTEFHIIQTKLEQVRLITGTFLGDTSINRIGKHFMSIAQNKFRWWMMNSLTYQQIFRRSSQPNENKAIRRHISKSEKSNNVDKYLETRFYHLDYLVIPVNLDGTHWVVYVADFKNRTILYYDALYSGSIDEHRQCISDIMDHIDNISYEGWNGEKASNPWEFLEVTNGPKQEDGVNCGVFILIVIWRLVNNEHSETLRNISYNSLQLVRTKFMAIVAGQYD